MKTIYLATIIKNWTDYEFEFWNKSAYPTKESAMNSLLINVKSYFEEIGRPFNEQDIEWIHYEDCATLNYEGGEVGTVEHISYHE